MLHRGVQKIAALILVIVILAAPTFCMCQEIDGQDHPRIERSHAAGHDSTHDCPDKCPGCPSENDQSSDHDASACYCSCHLPVIVQPIQINHVPLVSDLVAFEPFTALPEVCLPKFIPPQNQA